MGFVVEDFCASNSIHSTVILLITLTGGADLGFVEDFCACILCNSIHCTVTLLITLTGGADVGFVVEDFCAIH